MAMAVVIGAGGGLGQALVAKLARSERYDQVWALSRNPPESRGCVVGYRADPLKVDDISDAAARIAGPISRMIVTTGMLHDEAQQPEKSWRDLTPDHLVRSFAINAVAPALIARHFIPLFPRKETAHLAFLSARVGSISDNAMGGWYGYRASKAALNMIVKTLAIELARSHPALTCVALHPGTVDTGLSKPFQRNVPPEKLFSAAFSAQALLDVLDGLTPAQSGRHFAWDGTEISA